MHYMHGSLSRGRKSRIAYGGRPLPSFALLLSRVLKPEGSSSLLPGGQGNRILLTV